MVLQDAVERRVYTSTKDKVTYYSDIPLGVYVIRGDSIVLLGNVSDDNTNNQSSNNRTFPLKEVPLEELEVKVEEEKKEGTGEEPLKWDFDTDLIA